MTKNDLRIRLIEARLRKAGVPFRRLEDVPPKAIRAVYRFGLPDLRMIELPAKTIRAAIQKPLLCDLLVTRIGYHARCAGGYIPRPEGSLDHILIHCPEGEGRLSLGGREHVVRGGEMFCIPAGLPHWYGAAGENGWSNYWIHITGRQAGDYFRFLGTSVERPVLRLSNAPEVRAAFEETWGWMKAVHTDENLILASLSMGRYLSAAAPGDLGGGGSRDEGGRPTNPRDDRLRQREPRRRNIAQRVGPACPTLRPALHRRLSPRHRLLADRVFQPFAGAAGVRAAADNRHSDPPDRPADRLPRPLLLFPRLQKAGGRLPGGLSQALRRAKIGERTQRTVAKSPSTQLPGNDSHRQRLSVRLRRLRLLSKLTVDVPLAGRRRIG